MTVQITGIADAREAVLASGLSQWIESMGIEVTGHDAPISITMTRQPVQPPPVAQVDPPADLPRRANGSVKPKPVKAAKPVKAKAKHAPAEPKRATPAATVIPAQEEENPDTLRQRDIVLKFVEDDPQQTAKIAERVNAAYPDRFMTNSTVSAVLGQLRDAGTIERGALGWSLV